MPLVDGQRVLGVLNVNAAPETADFDDDTLERMSAFAARFGPVISQSQRLWEMQSRSAELTVRAELDAIAFSAEPLEEKLPQIVEIIDRACDVDGCAIYLYDDDRTGLWLRGTTGSAPGFVRVRTAPGTGLVGAVAANAEPIVSRATCGENGESIVLTVAVPVGDAAEMTGVLVVEKVSEVDMSSELVDTATSLGVSLGHVVAGARSTDESRDRLTRLSALSEIGIALTGVEDRTTFARLLAYSAATILETDVALVRLVPETGGSGPLASHELVAAHGRSLPEYGSPILTLEHMLLREVEQRNGPVSDQDLDPESRGRGLSLAQVASATTIPVRSGDDILGSVTVFDVETAPNRSQRHERMEIGVRLGDYAGAGMIQLVQIP